MSEEQQSSNDGRATDTLIFNEEKLARLKSARQRVIDLSGQIRFYREQQIGWKAIIKALKIIGINLSDQSYKNAYCSSNDPKAIDPASLGERSKQRKYLE